jgi:hypothetical protein
MWKVFDTNCSAPAGVDAPQLVHGIWYSYCAECATYHAVVSDDESSDECAASAPEEVMLHQPAGMGAGNVIPLRPRARAAGKVLHLFPRNGDAERPLSNS